MLILRQSTAIDIRMGPFVDATDGVTPETGVTLAGADQAEVLKENGAATVAMAGTFAAVTGSDGWYDYTVATGDVDTVGEVVFVVQDASVCLPVQRTAFVVEEAIYDAFYDGAATGLLPANVTQISGDATAADNLEAMYDGTGYANDEAPATQAQVGAIGAGSSSGFNFPVAADNTGGAIIDGVTFVGTQTGTFANTEANIATFHQIDHATNAFDLVYRISAGATNIFTSLIIDAYLTSSNDTANIQLYDHIGADWETVQVISGTNGTATTEYAIDALAKHTGALGTAEAGNAYVRFVTTGQTSPVLFIARCIGTAVAATSTMGYEAGSVYCDESNGTSSGIVQGIDGTFANQSDDFDNAQTIADGIGTSTITNHPGNSITLTAALQGYFINNVQATLNGGSQNADSTRVSGGFVAGTWNRAGTGIMTFVGCSLTSVTSDRCAILAGSGIVGTFTLSEAGLYPIVDCQAGGATGIATIDFASLGGATVNMEGWKGNLTITGMAAGDTLNLHAAAGGDIILGGANGTVYISGVVGSVTDNRTGSPTLTDLSTATRFTGVEGATFDTSTDSLEAIRNRGDSAWTTGAGGTPPQLLQSTTIATLASQTSFTLTAGSADDDAYNDAIAVVTDSATSTQKAVGTVSDYTGSTRTVTLSADPAIFTMAVGDTIEIIAALGSAGSAPTAAQIVDEWETQSQADPTGFHVNVREWLSSPATALETAVDVRTEMDSNSTQLAAIVADTNELQTDDVPGLISGLNDISTTQVNAEVDAALADYDGPTNAEMLSEFTDIKGATWDSTDSLEAIHNNTLSIDSQITGLNDVSVADLLTTQMTESYAADGVAPTLAQALFLIQQSLGDFAISGTTLTVRELDGSTTAATFTLDSATTPTSTTRAT